MATDANGLLTLTDRGAVRSRAFIHQTDDGTIFCFKASTPQRLYVKRQCCGAHGGAVYLIIKKKVSDDVKDVNLALQKVYKATFTHPDNLSVEFLRDLLKDELVDEYDRGFITRTRNGKKYVYRISDDPDRDGVHVDDMDRGLEIRGIHSGKVIYEKENDNAFNPRARLTKANGIVIECSRFFDIYTPPTLPFVYVLTEDAILWAMDVKTLQFMEPLRMENGTFDLVIHIHSIHNGVIYLDAMDTSIAKSHLVTAELPREYLENSINRQDAGARKPVKRRIGDIEGDLAISNRKILESETFIYQVDDGTIFYLKFSEPRRLYVKWKETEIDIGKLCEKIINDDCVAVFGNALYFESEDNEVCKVVFTPPDCVTISSRPLLKDEEFHFLGMCSRVRDGKKYVYRMCDDPDEDGVLVDEELDSDYLGAVYRGRQIYWSRIRDDTPSVKKLGDNAFALAMPEEFRLSLYAHESSTIVWFIYCNYLYPFDTETMEVLATYRIAEVYAIYSIAGIYNGVITLRVRFWTMNRPFLISVQLPEKYTDRTTMVVNGKPKECENSKWKLVHKVELKNEQELDRSLHDFSSKFAKEFDVKKILGVGGFGVVFGATCISEDFDYAVKRIAIKPSGKRFELKTEEAFSMLKLEHSGFVRYYFSWIEKPPVGWQCDTDTKILEKIGSSVELPMSNYADNIEFLYIKMELCQYSLSDWLEINTTDSSRILPRVKNWFKQIVEAVQYMHAKNLIHRDLKPGNILFRLPDFIKLCDVGVATDRRSNYCAENYQWADDSTILTRSKKRKFETEATRSRIGTELYMSPEQRSCIPNYSSKSDVFALGLILAELRVVMTPTERSEIFNNYRAGKQNDIFDDAETKEFVEMLTQLDTKKRPTCTEMLANSFLAQCTECLYDSDSE